MPSQIQAESAVVFCGGSQLEMWGGLSAQDEQGEEHPPLIHDATTAHKMKKGFCLEDRCGKRIQRTEVHRWEGVSKGKQKRD